MKKLKAFIKRYLWLHKQTNPKWFSFCRLLTTYQFFFFGKMIPIPLCVWRDMYYFENRITGFSWTFNEAGEWRYCPTIGWLLHDWPQKHYFSFGWYPVLKVRLWKV
jgi:hypothetical protein